MSQMCFQEPGFDIPLNKTMPTVSIIRQLRTEYLLLKIRMIKGKFLIKQPVQVNNEITRPGEQHKGKVGILEG